MKTSIRLGNKLSTVIRAAVADMKTVQRDKRYKLMMFTWHALQPLLHDVCGVCMAGSIIACRGGATPTASVHPSDFDPATKYKLYAVDSVRQGNIRGARFNMAQSRSLQHLAPPRVSATRAEAQNTAIEKTEVLICKHFDPVTGRAPTHIYTRAARMLQAVGL